MESNLVFTFRNRQNTCNVCIDNSEYPCFIFVTLDEKSLIEEFGEELTIKTDCEKLLVRNDDYTELVELRQAILDAVKLMPEFMVGKTRFLKLWESQSSYLKRDVYQ